MATAPKSTLASASRSGSASPEIRRQQVMVGNLPEDFLRITPTTQQQQIAADEQTALALQQQQYTRYPGAPSQGLAANIKGRLDVTLVEAKLVKNYGVTRMDPYVRLRVGHHVYETRTCYNGAKNPKWNKVFHCFLPNGIDTLSIEVYDERAFSVDEKVAWALHTIPESVFEGQTTEEWVSLNGKQGDAKEGSVCVVMSFTSMPGASAMFQVPLSAPTGLVMQPSGLVCGGPAATVGPTVYVDSHMSPAPLPPALQEPVALPVPAPVPVQVRIDEADVKLINEMFPDIEVEVIRAVMESERGNKDRTINTLLQMTNDTQ